MVLYQLLRKPLKSFKSFWKTADFHLIIQNRFRPCLENRKKKPDGNRILTFSKTVFVSKWRPFWYLFHCEQVTTRLYVTKGGGKKVLREGKVERGRKNIFSMGGFSRRGGNLVGISLQGIQVEKRSPCFKRGVLYCIYSTWAFIPRLETPFHFSSLSFSLITLNLLHRLSTVILIQCSYLSTFRMFQICLGAQETAWWKEPFIRYSYNLRSACLWGRWICNRISVFRITIWVQGMNCCLKNQFEALQSRKRFICSQRLQAKEKSSWHWDLLLLSE